MGGVHLLPRTTRLDSGGCVICALALFAAPVFAQTFGEITGHVSDLTGAAVPGAAVTLTNVGTNAARKTVTTDAGDYSLPSVPPGIYNLKIEHAGFKTANSNNVEVQVQQTVRLDFHARSRREFRSRSKSQAAADQLQAENATVGTVIENKGIVSFRSTAATI